MHVCVSPLMYVCSLLVYDDCSIREYLYALSILYTASLNVVTIDICVTIFLLLQIPDLAVIHKTA